MNRAAIIIFDHTAAEESIEIFTETVRSSYISKRMKNIFIISCDKDVKNKEIFNLLESKQDNPLDIIITNFEEFYGNFDREIIEWVKDTFSSSEYIEDN